jgi:hypothetical protein
LTWPGGVTATPLCRIRVCGSKSTSRDSASKAVVASSSSTNCTTSSVTLAVSAWSAGRVQRTPRGSGASIPQKTTPLAPGGNEVEVQPRAAPRRLARALEPGADTPSRQWSRRGQLIGAGS